VWPVGPATPGNAAGVSPLSFIVIEKAEALAVLPSSWLSTVLITLTVGSSSSLVMVQSAVSPRPRALVTDPAALQSVPPSVVVYPANASSLIE